MVLMDFPVRRKGNNRSLLGYGEGSCYQRVTPPFTSLVTALIYYVPVNGRISRNLSTRSLETDDLQIRISLDSIQVYVRLLFRIGTDVKSGNSGQWVASYNFFLQHEGGNGTGQFFCRRHYWQLHRCRNHTLKIQQRLIRQQSLQIYLFVLCIKYSSHSPVQPNKFPPARL